MRRTLTCRELIDFLDRYVDSALPAPTAARFEEHLAVCPACVDYLHSYRETIRLAADAWSDQAIAPGEVPTELVAAILDARRFTPEA